MMINLPDALKQFQVCSLAIFMNVYNSPIIDKYLLMTSVLQFRSLQLNFVMMILLLQL
jgi:hypothetical protein